MDHDIRQLTDYLKRIGCRVHLCDWLEQVPRCQQWDYRRAAYRHLAERLGGPALDSYNRVFSQETAEAAGRSDNS
jgi:hypothetical protein